MLRDSKYWYELTEFCRRCAEAISERTYRESEYMCVDCFLEVEELYERDRREGEAFDSDNYYVDTDSD